MTLQQTFVENIFHEMGYASSPDYAIRKVREEILYALKVCLERIEKFERKYGVGYDEVYKRFSELTEFSLFERKGDSMAWKAELVVLRGVEKRWIDYSYHWQTATHQFIHRWENAHPVDLSTSQFHQQIEFEENIQPSE